MIFQKYEVKEKIKLMILTLVKIILKHLNWKDSKQKNGKPQKEIFHLYFKSFSTLI